MTVSIADLQVEELSAAAAHRKVSNVRPPVCRWGSCFKHVPLEGLGGAELSGSWWQEGKGDPLEKYCGDNPEADECRCASLHLPQSMGVSGWSQASSAEAPGVFLRARACLPVNLPYCGISLRCALL